MNIVSQHEYERKLARALTIAGDTHDLRDLIGDIQKGDMQSFTVNDSWAVTRLLDCPKKRIVEVFLVTGDDADMPELELQVEAFARRHGATMLRAMGREGWAKRAPERGWTIGPRLYLKEL